MFNNIATDTNTGLEPQADVLETPDGRERRAREGNSLRLQIHPIAEREDETRRPEEVFLQEARRGDPLVPWTSIGIRDSWWAQYGNLFLVYESFPSDPVCFAKFAAGCEGAVGDCSCWGTDGAGACEGVKREVVVVMERRTPRELVFIDKL